MEGEVGRVGGCAVLRLQPRGPGQFLERAGFDFEGLRRGIGPQGCRVRLRGALFLVAIRLQGFGVMMETTVVFCGFSQSGCTAVAAMAGLLFGLWQAVLLAGIQHFRGPRAMRLELLGRL